MVLGLLQDMTSQSLILDVVSYSAAITACEKGQHWEAALPSLDLVVHKMLMPNALSFSVITSSFEKGQSWELALGLLQELFHKLLAADVVNFSAAISSCQGGGVQWNIATTLF